ncbi:MAG TPA: NAD(P)/FAD-dependent oxidoreductase [Actinomycetota bacterium]|nr:NAD(P)/FAD-dependent oxidoreductase [Actinomycetota bacterium]
MTDALMDRYDVVVAGGGPAGLNGALMLARSRRSVLVVDAGSPRNTPADGVHGLLGHDGTPPAELLERGRAEVRRYGGHVTRGAVTGAARDGETFVVTLGDGRTTRARRLLVATGVIDELPELEGLKERWGHDVLHCPYCHGWEVRDQAIGVLSSGPRSLHQALLFRQLSDDVVYFAHALPPAADEVEKLAARGIPVVDGEVVALEVEGDRLTGVRMRDGTTVPRQVLVVATRLVARAPFLDELGLRPAEHPSGLGEHVVVEPTGRTPVPGVWAAGNVTDPAAQVGGSAAAGATAGAQINADLVEEETRQAIEPAEGRG